MKIEVTPKEIADLVTLLQNRPIVKIKSDRKEFAKEIAEGIKNYSSLIIHS